MPTHQFRGSTRLICAKEDPIEMTQSKQKSIDLSLIIISVFNVKVYTGYINWERSRILLKFYFFA